MGTGEFNIGVCLSSVCVLVYDFNLYRDYDFIWGQFPLSCARRCIYVARNFCGCPACASSADVSVRKCHETPRGRGLLESHGLSETRI